MRMWFLLIGLLMLGLAAPFVASIVTSMVPLYTDPASQIVIFAALPIVLFLFVFFTLFAGD